MRHFYRVNSDDEIIGAVGCDDQFPADSDPTDPGCMHPTTIQLRKASEMVPGFARLVEYNCPCDSGDCKCVFLNRSKFYASGSQLVSKPNLTVLVDGVDQGGPLTDDPIVAAPGQVLKVKLMAAAPDGHQVDVKGANSFVSIIASPTTLTFNGGETEEFTLVAPAHGLVGMVFGYSKYTHQFRVHIKGWKA